MTRSMTAFARESGDTPWGALVWELRTVNARYLDISLRLPDDLRSLEPQAREIIGRRLTRGKVDAVLRFQSREAMAGATALDTDAARAVLAAVAQVAALEPRLAPPGAIDVLRWPGVLKSPALDLDALTQAAVALLEHALGELDAMRAREGEHLRRTIAERLATVARIAAGVTDMLPEITRRYRERLEERLSEIKTQLDPARLEQEIVLFAHRSDVAEELDRLRAHVAEAERTLTQPASAGRRLDFLMQEFNREANTLGSKATDIRLTNAVVELKVLIEQMREQVQNIE